MCVCARRLCLMCTCVCACACEKSVCVCACLCAVVCVCVAGCSHDAVHNRSSAEETSQLEVSCRDQQVYSYFLAWNSGDAVSCHLVDLWYSNPCLCEFPSFLLKMIPESQSTVQFMVRVIGTCNWFVPQWLRNLSNFVATGFKLARTSSICSHYFSLLVGPVQLFNVMLGANRERPKRDNDNWEPHLVDHQMLHLKPLFHFTIQKRDNTRGI